MRYRVGPARAVRAFVEPWDGETRGETVFDDGSWSEASLAWSEKVDLDKPTVLNSPSEHLVSGICAIPVLAVHEATHPRHRLAPADSGVDGADVAEPRRLGIVEIACNGRLDLSYLSGGQANWFTRYDVRLHAGGQKKLDCENALHGRAPG